MSYALAGIASGIGGAGITTVGWQREERMAEADRAFKMRLEQARHTNALDERGFTADRQDARTNQSHLNALEQLKQRSGYTQDNTRLTHELAQGRDQSAYGRQLDAINVLNDPEGPRYRLGPKGKAIDTQAISTKDMPAEAQMHQYWMNVLGLDPQEAARYTKMGKTDPRKLFTEVYSRLLAAGMMNEADAETKARKIMGAAGYEGYESPVQTKKIRVGDIRNGYRYKGGDTKLQSSWERE